MAEAFPNWGGGGKTNEQILFTYNQGRQWRREKFKKGGESIISTFFVKRIFFGRTTMKLIKKSSWGSGGMLPRKIFQNLHAVTAIFVLFNQFSGKFCLKFFEPNSECFAKYDTICSHIFDYVCLRLIAIEEVQNYGKIV